MTDLFSLLAKSMIATSVVLTAAMRIGRTTIMRLALSVYALEIASFGLFLIIECFRDRSVHVVRRTSHKETRRPIRETLKEWREIPDRDR